MQKTVVRAGFGINYNPIRHHDSELRFPRGPFQHGHNLLTGVTGLTGPAPLTIVNGFPAVAPSTITNNFAVEPNYAPRLRANLNLDQQRELRGNVMLNVEG